MRALRRYGDQLVGFALALSYAALLILTADDIGLSRDEGFYAIAARRYAAWFELLADDPKRALQRDAIDQRWKTNHEHPPLMKSAAAWAHLAHDRGVLAVSPSLALRLPGIATAALLPWLIYIFGVRAFGRTTGLFAAGAFALMPRVFYHAHLDAFDVAVTLMMTWTTYAYWRSLRSWRWGLVTGISFFAALATKHNSWLLPGVLLIHYGWVWVAQRRHGAAERLRPAPWGLIAMGVLSPLLFVASWPWLWHDTWPRFVAYVRFHVEHVYYNMAYFGTNYFEPPFPVMFPWVMTLFTVPLTTLALALAGLWDRLPELLPPWSKRAAERADDRHTAVLMVGCMLAPLLVISMPWTPIFGGTKHWFPAYPFLALFAGVGISRLLGEVKRRLPGRADAASALIVLPGMLLPAALETAHSHPFGLSHYGVAAGGVPGAADKGMNRQFWGFTTRSLAGFFREHMPQGGKVWICDTTYEAFRMLHRDGLLPRNIRSTRHIARADFAIVHHELHFAEVDYQIWSTYGTVEPVYVLDYDGVPIISVYENPRP